MIKSRLKICVIGTGYVGLVTGTCLAEIGHRVICVDNNSEKIARLKKGISPIYEPGLDKLILKNQKNKRLFFFESVSEAVKKSDVVFIAVHTPTKENGETDLSHVENVSRDVARAMDVYKVIISKSTMPVKTGQKIKEIISKFAPKGISFDVVSNPEFLREGTAVNDFLKPDRIVVGLESKRAEKIMKEVYRKIKAPVIFTSIESAEIIKHACNSFLATKISFINAIAEICERNGCDVNQVSFAMGLDKRIGGSFLNAGIGFGGSCFPKDLSAFVNVAEKSGYDFKLLRQVREINLEQRKKFVEKIKKAVSGTENKKLAIMGLAFKPGTDDMREAPSIDIINFLLSSGAKIKAFDPAAMDKARDIFGEKIIFCKDMYETMIDADALIILTEWDIFKKLDFAKARKIMRSPIIVDGRNIFDPNLAKKADFKYYSIGRGNERNNQ